MTIPSANDHYLILHQIKLFKIERFTASNSVTPKTETQNYLSYFIGKLTYSLVEMCLISTYLKMLRMISRQMHGHQLVKKSTIQDGKIALVEG